MGGTRLGGIAKKLIRHGRPRTTPCALLYWGTTAKERRLFSTLGHVAQEAARLRFKTPTLFVVGKVAGARRLGSWNGSKRLNGKKILVTRPRKQASELVKGLRARGARVIGGATIRIRPASSFQGLDRAIRNIKVFDWLVFTSPNGVESFFKRWHLIRKNARLPKLLRVAVIGPATKAAARSHGVRVHLEPEQYQAEGLLRAFRANRIRIRGQRFLLPRAARVRPVLTRGLKKWGARTQQVEAYRIEADRGQRQALRRIAAKSDIDCITFTSSSTVEQFLQMLGPRRAHRIAARAATASIGPITSQTLSRLGFSVDIEAKKSTIPELVRAIEEYYG